MRPCELCGDCDGLLRAAWGLPISWHRWVDEFSVYDAGWLHAFQSVNGGELRSANWDDLNLPARLATLSAARLPSIQRVNDGSIVATQTLVQALGTGIRYNSFEDLAANLHDEPAMSSTRERVWATRERFMFDTHAPALVDFFRRVIDAAARKPERCSR